MPSLLIPPWINAVRVNGYAAVGDGGSALFKKVIFEPPHDGKFQSDDGAWWEIVVPADGLDVRAMGVKANGSADDHAALVRADSVSNRLRFPPGRVLPGEMFTPTSHPIKWTGAGKGVIKTGSVSNKSTQIVGNHFEAGVIEINPSVNAASENFTIERLEITGRISGAPDDQHGLIIRGRWHGSLLDRVTFSCLTGLGIAVDPGTVGNPSYAQNVHWTDISMYSVGGVIGYTREPVAGQSNLICTQLLIDNFNFDHRVNTQSAAVTIFDFRGFREIIANGIVIEGAGDAATTTVFSFATNAYAEFNNLHIEFTSAAPTYIAYFHSDPDNKFYSSNDSKVVFNGLSAAAKFGFGAGVETDVLVRDWIYYDAKTWKDLVEFTDHGGSLTIERFAGKVLIEVPPHLAGQLRILSQKSMDVLGPPLVKGPTKLASWRPRDGAIDAFSTRFVDGSLTTTASSAIQVDPDDARLNVFRTVGTAGNMGNIRWDVNLPADWIVGGIGPVLVAVARYRIVKNPADTNVTAQVLSVSSADAVASTRVGLNTGVTNGSWQTGIYSFRPNKAIFKITSLRTGTPTVPMNLSVASWDIFLGSDWQEPLDLEHP